MAARGAALRALLPRVAKADLRAPEVRVVRVVRAEPQGQLVMAPGVAGAVSPKMGFADNRPMGPCAPRGSCAVIRAEFQGAISNARNLVIPMPRLARMAVTSIRKIVFPGRCSCRTTIV